MGTKETFLGSIPAFSRFSNRLFCFFLCYEAWKDEDYCELQDFACIKMEPPNWRGVLFCQVCLPNFFL